jgi:hypothetical protein
MSDDLRAVFAALGAVISFLLPHRVALLARIRPGEPGLARARAWTTARWLARRAVAHAGVRPGDRRRVWRRVCAECDRVTGGPRSGAFATPEGAAEELTEIVLRVCALYVRKRLPRERCVLEVHGLTEAAVRQIAVSVARKKGLPACENEDIVCSTWSDFVMYEGVVDNPRALAWSIAHSRVMDYHRQRRGLAPLDGVEEEPTTLPPPDETAFWRLEYARVYSEFRRWREAYIALGTSNGAHHPEWGPELVELCEFRAYGERQAEDAVYEVSFPQRKAVPGETLAEAEKRHRDLLRKRKQRAYIAWRRHLLASGLVPELPST